MAFSSLRLLTISEELRNLFKWNPPTVQLLPTSSKSPASRKPSFYDKLLDEDYILHHVRSLPSLAKDIANTSDTTLQSINDSDIQLPPAAMAFPTATARLVAAVDRGMQNEGSVAQFYGRTTATYCSTVASMLALHPSIPVWTSILSWTATPSKSGYAIADGSVNIVGYSEPPIDEFDEIRKDIWDSLEPSLCRVLLRVKEVYPDLATWEIKSLSVGTHEVMEGVRREATTGIRFRWERFDKFESTKSRRQFEKPSVGPDATVTPWTLELPSESSASQASMDAPEPSTSSRIGARTPKRQKAKKRNPDDDDENYKNPKELTAEIFLQQVRSISWL